MRFFVRTVILLLVIGFATPSDATSIRLTTWNLQWFPNNNSSEESPVEKQNARIAAAATVLRSINPDIILLQEVKDWDTCERLAKAIKPDSYQVAVCSAFRDGGQITKQQVAILSKEYHQAAWSERWQSMDGVDPPRGFAFAWLKIKGADVGVYSVHLKSNRPSGKDAKGEPARNIRKREISAKQLLNHIHDVVSIQMPNVRSIIIGGDMNTNVDQFAQDQTINTLTNGGFVNCMDKIALSQRVTHPRTRRFPDATFDYFFALNASIGLPQITKTSVSDHFPVTCDVNIKPSPAFPVAAETSASSNAALPSPQSVTITQPVEIAVVYGKTVIPKGLKLAVVKRDATTVWVRYMDENYAVPVSSTDLK